MLDGNELSMDQITHLLDAWLAWSTNDTITDLHPKKLFGEKYLEQAEFTDKLTQFLQR